MKVVEITKEYFKLEDGRIFDFPMELDDIPSMEEFQKIVDGWESKLKEEFND